MLSETHLTSHSRMSGSMWVTAPLWLPGLLRSFVYNCSVYFYHVLLIFSASVRSLPFLSFIVLILAWNVPLISPVFLKRFLVFPILLFSSVPHGSLKKVFLYRLAILWNFAFTWVYVSLLLLPFASLLSSAISNASSDNHFTFLHFFFLEMVLVTISSTRLGTSVHSSSGTLSTRSNSLNLFLFTI